MLKYFLYARKSTDEDDRQILSIDAQLAELKEFAAKEKLEIAASFEEAKTAKEPGRMRFGEMLALIENGQADGILAWHPDRLARNPIDGGKIIYMVDTGKIKSLKFPTFWFEDTPQGKFMLNIAFGQSKYFIDNLSENVKRGLRQKLRRGEYPGWAPLGYLNDYKNHNIKIDKKKHKLVKRIFELYSTGGYTLKNLTDKFNELGLRSQTGKSITPGMIHFILKNPFYYGVFKYKDELHEGKHEPIITKKLFDQAQEMLKKRGRSHEKKIHNYIFTNFMNCGACGCSITAETSKGHIYYSCTNYHKAHKKRIYVKEAELLEPVLKLLDSINLPDEKVKELVQDLKQATKSENRFFTNTLQELRKEYDKIENRKSKLQDDKYDGSITNDFYDKKFKEYTEKQAKLMTEISKHDKANNQYYITANTILNLAKRARKIFENSEVAEKRQFLNYLLQNCQLKDKNLSYKLKTPFDTVLSASKCSNLLPGWDSNPRPIGYTYPLVS